MDAANDLLKPLGLEPKPTPSRRLPLLVGLGLALVAATAAAAFWLGRRQEGTAATTAVLVPIIDRAAPAAGGAPPQAGREGQADPVRRTAEEVEAASGVSVVRPPGAAAPGALVIKVPEDVAVRLAPAPDPRLVERTRNGLLPRIGPDGSRPAEVYARPAGSAGQRQGLARIALVVGGLGISPAASADAIAKLAPAMTLAFAPYGTDLDRLVARAREQGHEVMLQVPMEPFDYPDSDPGPHTLRAGAKPQENIDRLHWVMGRFTGYVGVTNFMGAKLTADDAALTPVLREIGRRGLVFLDDGSSSRSLVATVGAAAQVQTLRAAIVVDAVPRAEAIDRELARLEALAREKGFAVATATALPVTVERILRWARSLEDRGVVLVPASAGFAALRS